MSTIGMGRIFFSEIFVDEIVSVTGPAKAAGIQVGDRLVSLNGSVVRQALSALKTTLDEGVVGETISLTVARRCSSTLKPINSSISLPVVLDFEIARDFLPVVQVEHRLLPSGVGYLSIKEFSERTYIDTVSALNSLKGEAKDKNCKLGGIIIDLRGNLGGTVTSALDVAALFLRRGKVLLKVKMIKSTQLYFSSHFLVLFTQLY
jgi:carboxyl-terminal processing protease